jgi:DnaK suppressor protein
MEIEKRQTIRKQIMEKIAALKEDIKSFKLLTKPIAPDSAIGRLTRMEAINSKSINEAALNKSKLLLSKLEHALTLIDDPDFGFCRECEEPIPYARLMAIPETELCVQCAEDNNL